MARLRTQCFRTRGPSRAQRVCRLCSRSDMCAARSSGRVHQQLQAAQNVQACMLCAGHRFLWPTLTTLHGCSVSRAVPPHRVRQCSRPRAHGRPLRCCWWAAGRSRHRRVAWRSPRVRRSPISERRLALEVVGAVLLGQGGRDQAVGLGAVRRVREAWNVRARRRVGASRTADEAARLEPAASVAQLDSRIESC